MVKTTTPFQASPLTGGLGELQKQEAMHINKLNTNYCPPPPPLHHNIQWVVTETNKYYKVPLTHWCNKCCNMRQTLQ